MAPGGRGQQIFERHEGDQSPGEFTPAEALHGNAVDQCFEKAASRPEPQSELVVQQGQTKRSYQNGVEQQFGDVDRNPDDSSLHYAPAGIPGDELRDPAITRDNGGRVEGNDNSIAQ